MKIAEWIIAFIGILTPWYFLCRWLFLTNKLYSFQLSGFGFSAPSYESLSVELIGISLICLMIIAGAFYVHIVYDQANFAGKKKLGADVFYTWSLQSEFHLSA